MRRLPPLTILLILAGVAAIIIALVMVTRGGGGASQDKLSDDQLATRAQGQPSERCASQRTYDAIKRELFRQAADTRGSDQDVFDRLAAYASVRMERPVLRSSDEDLGTLRCSGRLSLDLPPGVAVVGGRRTLAADVDYVLQPAADGSGDVVILEGADPIIVPLATLARTGNNMPPPTVPQAPAPGTELPGEVPPAAPAPPRSANAPPPHPQQPAPPVARQPQPVPEPRPQATARPSFNCQYARTPGEIAVCNDAGLAALDRQMASQFYRALSQADAGQRVQLQRTRGRFLRYRDACRSDACIADAYRGRMAEIGDIMAR